MKEGAEGQLCRGYRSGRLGADSSSRGARRKRRASRLLFNNSHTHTSILATQAERVFSLSAHTDGIWDLAVLPDEGARSGGQPTAVPRVVTCSSDGTVRLWNVVGQAGVRRLAGACCMGVGSGCGCGYVLSFSLSLQ